MNPPRPIQLPLSPADDDAKQSRQRLDKEKRDQLRAVLYEWVDAGHRMFGDDIMVEIVNHGGKVPYPVTRSHVVSIRQNDNKLVVTRHKRTPAEEALIARMTGKDAVKAAPAALPKPLPDDAWGRERDYLRNLADELRRKVVDLQQMAASLSDSIVMMDKRADVIERALPAKASPAKIN